MEPIAYTYEASEHCPPCAFARFGDNAEGTDNEGNPVGAAFDAFDDRSMVCGTCGDVINELDSDEDDEYDEESDARTQAFDLLNDLESDEKGPCDSCAVANINGVRAHEHGCPRYHRLKLQRALVERM